MVVSSGTDFVLNNIIHKSKFIYYAVAQPGGGLRDFTPPSNRRNFSEA